MFVSCIPWAKSNFGSRKFTIFNFVYTLISVIYIMIVRRIILKKRMVMFISIIFILMLGTSCVKAPDNKATINEIPSYYIYGLSGMDIFVGSISISQDDKVGLIKSEKIDMESIGYLSAIKKISDGNILCAFYGVKEKEGKNLHVIDNGSIVSSKVFDELEVFSNQIIDEERNLAYLFGRTQDKDTTPKGTPIEIIDLDSKKVIDQLHFKGELYGCSMNDSYIYITVLLGKTYGYNDVEEAYIARINRETREYEILTKDGLDFGPIDIVATNDNTIYTISCINPRKNGGVNEPKISKFDEKGNLISEYEIPLWCDHMVIDDEGIIYINHIGKENMGDYEGEIMTVFDTKTDKIIDTIDGFKGCSNIKIAGEYLFVANYLTGDISVLKRKDRKLIGTFSIEDDGRLRQIEVIENTVN